MRFAVPVWLWLVPLLPFLWLLLRAADRRARGRLERLLGPRAAGHVEMANPRLLAWQRFFLFGGLFWLLLALARPQWGASEVTVTQRGSDIVVALDISNSMLAEDVPPTRMERAKAELASFLDRLEDSRIGLVFFAGSAFVQCPLTLDYGTAGIFLNMAGPDMMSAQGTAIGAALDASRELLAKGRGEEPGGTFQAILLVTDGEDLEGDWRAAARRCVDDGIRLIPVGVGEESGGLIPVRDARGRPAGFMKDPDGNVVTTRLDLASLEEMAALGGGSAFRIGVDGLAGDRLFAELERLGRRDLEERRVSAFQERYLIPLLLAMGCFALRMLLFARRRPRVRGPARREMAAVTVVAAALFLAAAGSASAGLVPAGRSDLAEGRRLYQAGDFAGALSAFEHAQTDAPDDPVISLARGAALFRLGRYEDAAGEFDRARGLAGDPGLEAEALYNGGTSLLAGGKPDQAVDRLRESLALEADRQDALLNLEVALRRLQQQQQQQQQQDQDQQEKQDKQDKQDQQKQDQQQQDQKQQDQQQQDQQQQDQQQQDQQQQDQQQDQQEQDQETKPEPQARDQDQPGADAQPTEEELSREQAEKILKALDRDEQELKRSVQKRLKGGKPKSGKRW